MTDGHMAELRLRYDPHFVYLWCGLVCGKKTKVMVKKYLFDSESWKIRKQSTGKIKKSCDAKRTLEIYQHTNKLNQMQLKPGLGASYTIRSENGKRSDLF